MLLNAKTPPNRTSEETSVIFKEILTYIYEITFSQVDQQDDGFLKRTMHMSYLHHQSWKNHMRAEGKCRNTSEAQTDEHRSQMTDI